MIVYVLKLVSVIDGDTIRGRTEIWPDIEVSISVRVSGIDTPELRGSCLRERELAAQAKSRVVELMNNATVTIANVQHDKYAGRVDADVFVNGKSIREILLSENLAKIYDGKTKPTWC